MVSTITTSLLWSDLRACFLFGSMCCYAFSPACALSFPSLFSYPYIPSLLPPPIPYGHHQAFGVWIRDRGSFHPHIPPRHPPPLPQTRLYLHTCKKSCVASCTGMWVRSGCHFHCFLYLYPLFLYLFSPPLYLFLFIFVSMHFCLSFCSFSLLK